MKKHALFILSFLSVSAYFYKQPNIYERSPASILSSFNCIDLIHTLLPSIEDILFEKKLNQLGFSKEDFSKGEFFRPHHGHSIDPNFSYEGVDSNGFRALGEGSYAEVYLVQARNKKIFSLKKYKSLDSKDRDDDVRSFEFLKSFLKETNEEDLKIPYIKLGKTDNTLEIEHIPGQSLSDILNDISIPIKLRKKLLENYKKIMGNILTKLQDEIRKNYEVTQDSFPLESLDLPVSEIPYFDFVIKNVDESKDIYISSKPDNIIIHHKTLEFYLIDPY